MRVTQHAAARSAPAHGALMLVLVLAALAWSAGRASAQPGAPAPTLDNILTQVASYDGGVESAALWTLRDYVRARKDDPTGRAECETALLRFLTSPATPVAKMVVCRHLRLIAGDTAVPALQTMLADERTADMALYALQGITGDVAERALIQALATATGATRTTVAAALGERRAAAAVPALVALISQPGSSAAALTAVGRIGGEAAATALVEAYARVSADLKPVAASSMLETSNGLLAAKHAVAARRLFDLLSSDASLPVPLRKAAAMGKLSAAGSSAPSLLLNMLGGTDPELQEAAIAKVSDVFAPASIDPVCAALPRLPERAQIQLLAVLSGYPADRVLPAVHTAAQSGAVPVRIAAMKALASVGGPSVVAFLAERAATAAEPEQAAARAALGVLKGRAVDEAILGLLSRKPADAVAGELLWAVAERRVFPAKQAVAGELTAPAAAVRRQALKALRAIGTPSDIPAVLDLLLASSDEAERAEAEKTAGALARKIINPDGRARFVKTRLAAETAPGAKVRLLALFPLLGDDSALPIVRTALEDGSPDVIDAAARALADWPAATARDDVLRLAEGSTNETHRLLALGGFVRIVGLDPYRRPEAAVGDLKRAAGLAWRPEEKKLVLAALVAFPCKDAIDLATGLMNDPAVKAEAQAAIDKITQRLSK